ncbi:ATP synthase F1 subunit epsilon [[Clostridium] polysaccharolyticum]|uniref:ATP synthase epsilon chain n=1 Tax=[Clostridium] polysaccharolyticum TaxID=29364 RepID=A0A1H9ZXL4_9FIRM|nr:ATP synthase F1 subunit epsilon [[Clostridium] polysaccharolyticum]SES86544.1 ATP synthase F1 subcomplex epsilon subunit [[Clostridium] polysaccharolyticum]
MDPLFLKVITFEREFYFDKCTQVVFTMEDGEVAIQAHHENMLFAVDPGEIRVAKADGSIERGVLGTGFAYVMNNRVIIMVDTAEHPDEIDMVRAERARLRAQEQLRQKQSIAEYYHTQISMAKAISRMKVRKKYKI